MQLVNTRMAYLNNWRACINHFVRLGIFHIYRTVHQTNHCCAGQMCLAMGAIKINTRVFVVTAKYPVPSQLCILSYFFIPGILNFRVEINSMKSKGKESTEMELLANKMCSVCAEVSCWWPLSVPSFSEPGPGWRWQLGLCASFAAWLPSATFSNVSGSSWHSLACSSLHWAECAVRVSQDKGMFPELNFSVSNSTLNKVCNFRVWFWSLAMISWSLLWGSLEFTGSVLI